MAACVRMSKCARQSRKDLRMSYSKDENLEGIKDVIKQLEYEIITAEQFVAIVGLHTGDRGVALTKVMTEDLNCFRKMVETVYETMTQDISDVLANEQMELAKMYEDKHKNCVEKIMENCKKLKVIYPPFNFEEYYENPEVYLKKAFIVPEMPEEEEFDMVKRHLAFHRLQWMYSEGQRLKAENLRLEKRLAEMKREQRASLKIAVKKEVAAEQIHEQLVKMEEELQIKLDSLNERIQGSIIEDERALTKWKRNEAKRRCDIKRDKDRICRKCPLKDIEEQREWNVAVAQEIETSHLVDHIQSKLNRGSESNCELTPASKPSPLGTDMKSMQELMDELNRSLQRIGPNRVSCRCAVNERCPKKRDFNYHCK